MRAVMCIKYSLCINCKDRLEKMPSLLTASSGFPLHFLKECLGEKFRKPCLTQGVASIQQTFRSAILCVCGGGGARVGRLEQERRRE